MPNTTNHVTTAEQLAALPDDGKRYELVEGVLHMMSPAGGQHGKLALKLGATIREFVQQHGLGETYGAETGFLIGTKPDTVLAPDFAFACRARVGELGDHPGFLPFIPDLVAEIVSPNDRSRDVEAKAQAWLDAGVRVVLVVDPRTSTVDVHRPGNAPEAHTAGFVDLDDVLPGFQLDVADLFA